MRVLLEFATGQGREQLSCNFDGLIRCDGAQSGHIQPAGAFSKFIHQHQAILILKRIQKVDNVRSRHVRYRWSIPQQGFHIERMSNFMFWQQQFQDNLAASGPLRGLVNQARIANGETRADVIPFCRITHNSNVWTTFGQARAMQMRWRSQFSTTDDVLREWIQRSWLVLGVVFLHRCLFDLRHCVR